MKKRNTLLFTLLISFLVAGTAFGQKNGLKTKSKIDTRIDNMGYWTKLAEEGLVPVAQPVPIKPAVYTGSQIVAKSVIGGKEDSPDVPVTNLTNVTETEVSVFVNPDDVDNLLNSNNSTSWNGSSVGSLYGANYFLSTDAGLTWGGSQNGAGGTNNGDPATAINLDGSRMYVGFINSAGGQGVSHSTDGGNTWTQVQAGTPPGGWDILDKNHMWIDNSPASPYEGNLYNAWTAFGNANENDIEIVHSSDGGMTWSSHLNISSAVNAGSHNQGVNLQTGPNGEVYAIWAIYDSWPQDEKAIGFAKSTDGGQTFANATRIIDNIRGIRNSGVGKSMRVNSFPVMAVDISNGGFSGNIYVVWCNIGVPGTNTGSDADVYMIRSEDEGATWSDPVRINQDPIGQGKKHYMPWITCDPETGTLSAIWYDDRNVSSSQCEVFCANSFDGGETWEDFKVSDVAFTPTPIAGLAGDYMGDYIGITARGSKVYPAWMDTRDNLFMTYVSPYVTNNLPKPTDLIVTLDEETGATTLNWTYEEKEFLHFNIYRDGELLGTTTETTYSDNLPDYGVFQYSVTAMHDEGESVGAFASIQWGNPHISVTPDAMVQNLMIGASDIQNLTIENTGELELSFDITPEITSEKGVNDYCDAGGGCDEYISNVTFGTINNSSSCDGYADYTSMSTMVNKGESYDITVTNGNVYTSDDLGVWIDWNIDGDFDDPGENVVCEADNSGQGTFSITVPADATPGETVMRVRIKYSGSDCGDPCGTTQYGEVEDYGIYVLGWLMLDHTDGNLNAGETDVIQVTFDAADLDEGVYTANLNISSNDADMPLTVVPVTLNVGADIPETTVSADPEDVCPGESSQLTADATGGSGNYTYSWTSLPEGFTSDEQNPVVTPADTTKYVVAVNDGMFTVYDTVIVNVKPLPMAPAIPGGEVVLCQDGDNTEYTTEGAMYAQSYMWAIDPADAGTITGTEMTGEVDWNANFSGEALITVKGINECGEGDFSDALTVMINALPEVSFDLIDTVCVYNEEFELTGGLPEGGEYSGTGVLDGMFYPETAGLGNHTITYTVTGENGCENYAEQVINVSECIGIDEVFGGMKLNIFPNPNTGVFNLEISSLNAENLDITIYNNIGVLVYESRNLEIKGNYSSKIDLSDFSSGLYFINLSKDGDNYSEKIIIRK